MGRRGGLRNRRRLAAVIFPRVRPRLSARARGRARAIHRRRSAASFNRCRSTTPIRARCTRYIPRARGAHSCRPARRSYAPSERIAARNQHTWKLRKKSRPDRGPLIEFNRARLRFMFVCACVSLRSSRCFITSCLLTPSAARAVHILRSKGTNCQESGIFNWSRSSKR